METFAPLSLSALISFLVCSASCCLAFIISERNKSAIIESAVGKEPSLKKNVRELTGTKIFIPNAIATWPWRRQINPNYPVVKKEVDAWINSFQAFSPKAQDAFSRCDFNLLACLAYTTERKEYVRAACDLLHVLYVVDEYWEKSTPSDVRMQKDMIQDAFRNPHIPRPKGEWVGGEVTRQFWERTIQNASAGSQKRLIEYMNDTLEAAVQESIDKNDHRILGIKGYIDARRSASGVKPMLAILEMGLDIPDEVMSHPAVQAMMVATVDLVAFGNDILSYNLEQHCGDDIYNLITCVMNEYHTDVNSAMLWAEGYLLGAVERFHVALAALPQWEEPVNSQVKEYCDGLGQWVRALDDWSFESERYFGNKGLEIKEKRWVLLLPKERKTEIGPVHIDSSLL